MTRMRVRCTYHNRRRGGLNRGGCDGLDNWQLTKLTDIIIALNMFVLPTYVNGRSESKKSAVTGPAGLLLLKCCLGYPSTGSPSDKPASGKEHDLRGVYSKI